MEGISAFFTGFFSSLSSIFAQADVTHPSWTKFIFLALAGVIVTGSILTVTSRRILRAATFLFFTLLGTAGIYLLLEYEFLAAVQLTVYAGGILVVIVFSILLTSHISYRFDPPPFLRVVAGLVAAGSGFMLILCVLVLHVFPAPRLAASSDMHRVGLSLLGQGAHGYVLPFEVISVLLLASMIGAIVVARKSDEPEIDKEDITE